jgi:hypothetical protein
MATHNPYSPPRAPVADIPQVSAAQAKRSLLPLWLASLYCIVVGVGAAIFLLGAIYRALDLILEETLPVSPWVYLLAFAHPIARLAAGVGLLRRSRFSPALLGVLLAITVVFPFLGRFALHLSTLPSGPSVGLFLADVTLLILITRYAFALRSRGVLR